MDDNSTDAEIKRFKSTNLLCDLQMTKVKIYTHWQYKIPFLQQAG